MVNIEAKLKRHAKIKETLPKTAPDTAMMRESFFAGVTNKLCNIFRLQTDNPATVRLAKRIVTFTVAFLLLTPFVPLYQFTEGYQPIGENYSVMDFTEQGTEFALAEVMTEDGFLLKPALNSTEGDRSTANEIFAYTVQPGDTLSTIAERFGIKKETLVMENNLWNVNNVRSGTTLNILPVDGISHLVKKGDTVDKVAKKYKVDKELIIRQNQLEEGQELLADTALIIPGAKKAIQPTYASSAPSNIAAYHYNGPSTGRLIWPTLTKAKVTQGFRRGHYALDIANRAKGPIFAAASGKVVRADYGWSGGYGNVIIIDHGNGMQTLYGHNEKLYVTEGQYVEQGQTIAWMGNSGRVYGPTGIHVHFEVRINGVKYNPMNFF